MTPRPNTSRASSRLSSRLSTQSEQEPSKRGNLRLAVLWVLVAIFGAACYLIARAVDARAAQQRGQMD